MAEHQKATNVSSSNSSEKFAIITWNVQGGITDSFKAETICQDLEKKKTRIGILQETRNLEDTVYQNKAGWLILKAASQTQNPHKRYGLGFYICTDLLSNVWYHKSISDRIAVLRLSLNQGHARNNYLTVINVYAPHSQITKMCPEEREQFYKDLQETYDEHKSGSSIMIVGGDFNSKLGIQKDISEDSIGKHGKGKRNANGESLLEFLQINKLYATNTHFKQKSCRKSTWHGFLQNQTVHNQIDFICINQRLKPLLRKSRSYYTHLFPSDHSIVKTTLNMKEYYRIIKKEPKQKKKRWNTAGLARSKKLATQYQLAIANQLPTYTNETHPRTQYQNLVAIIKDVADKLLPQPTRPKQNHSDSYSDPEIQLYSVAQAELRRKILLLKPFDANSRNKLLKERKLYLHKLKKRLRRIRHEEIEHLLEDMEQYKGDRRVYEIQRQLRFEKRPQFTLTSEEGYHIANIREQIQRVTTHYQQFFNQEGIDAPTPFDGIPRPLANRITPEETANAKAQLSNQRCPGTDEVPGELLKYGGRAIDENLAQMFNTIFETHQSIPELCEGLLIVLNKPGKQPQIKNTRPIQVLNSIRKILSTVLFNRIDDYIDKFLDQQQSGFRKHRSTADIIWAYRWLMATAKLSDRVFDIIGTDLSKAFDCLNRKQIIDIFSMIIPPSELRILRFLLADTTMKTRIQGILGEAFATSLGTPQGEGLSPKIFTVIFCVLDRAAEIRINTNALSLPHKQENIFYLATMYADDADKIRSHREGKQQQHKAVEQNVQHLNILREEYGRGNLKLNQDKTEYITISKETVMSKLHQHPLDIRKLGNRLDSPSDLNLRKRLAEATMNKMKNLFNKKGLSTKLRIRMFNCYVNPILTYNISCTAATDSELQSLDSFHRRLLRRALRIYYPLKISNERLYSKTQTTPLSLSIYKQRWELFGRILRGPRDVPAYRTMIEFVKTVPQSKRNNRTIVSALKSDLKNGQKLINTTAAQFQSETIIRPDFTTIEGLGKLRIMALNRYKWTNIVVNPIIASKAQQQMEQEAIRKRKRKDKHTDRRPRKKRLKLTLLTIKIGNLKRKLAKFKEAKQNNYENPLKRAKRIENQYIQAYSWL